jgi:ABC-2 type transport system permease protein
MHPSFFMLEKELLEHKIITRLPLYLLLIGFLMLAAIVINMGSANDISIQFNYQGDMANNGLDLTPGISSLISFAAGIVSLFLSIVYLSSTFRKERQEGSLMFWRSMPVSDLLTHGVKLGVALILIPLICSLLLLCSELFIWLISLTQAQHFMGLLTELSLFSITSDWLLFLAKMMLVSLSILPLACLLLAVSQRLNSPLLMVIIGAYTLKLLSRYVFALDGVATFIHRFSTLPFTLLSSPQPLVAFAQVSWCYYLLYYLLGALCLMVSLSIRKHGELNIRAMFARS